MRVQTDLLLSVWWRLHWSTSKHSLSCVTKKTYVYIFSERQETSRKHKTNPCAEKGKTPSAGHHRKPLLQHKSLHITCRSFRCKHDITLFKYPTSNPNPHTADGCTRHYWLNDQSRLDLIPSLILNYSILIAWRLHNDVFTAFVGTRSVSPEICGAQGKLRL